MENAEKVTEASKPKKDKMLYFDKQFKKHLTKALQNNRGEPENINKIRCNRFLEKYSESKVVQFVNDTALEVQKDVESSLKGNKRAEEASQLATFFNSLSNDEKSCDELKFILKLDADGQSQNPNPNEDPEKVDFIALHKFLYSAVSGNPDTTTLNQASIAVLDDTLRMLNEQVDKDTSSNDEFLQDLCSKLFHQEHEVDEIPETSKIFQNFNLNPTNLPLKYLLNETFDEKEES